jgi:putative copper resistance protein D
MSAPPVRRIRRGGLLALTWAIALAALAVLAVAVARHLSGSGGGMAGMPGMGGGSTTADALVRGGADPAGALLGSALYTKWQVNAIALAVLVLLAAWYLTMVALVPIREPGARWPLVRTLSFFAGLVVCGYATNGAIAVYDQVLFTAHMAGHLALVMLGPALLMAGNPLALLLAGSPPRRRERLQRVLRGRVISVLTAPPVTLATYTVVIVGSHLTGLMNVIMTTTWVGELEHFVYIAVGCQFFVLILGEQPIRWRLSSPVRWLLLALSMAVDTFTGIVLMQGTQTVDMVHSASLHVDALSDTRTGGAIMWVGGDGIMMAVMVALVIGWLRRVDVTTPDEKGWLEQARRATFAAHTGNDTESAEHFDDGDSARASYNAWLAELERRG